MGILVVYFRYVLCVLVCLDVEFGVVELVRCVVVVDEGILGGCEGSWCGLGSC